MGDARSRRRDARGEKPSAAAAVARRGRAERRAGGGETGGGSRAHQVQRRSAARVAEAGDGAAGLLLERPRGVANLVRGLLLHRRDERLHLAHGGHHLVGRGAVLRGRHRGRNGERAAGEGGEEPRRAGWRSAARAGRVRARERERGERAAGDGVGATMTRRRLLKCFSTLMKCAVRVMMPDDDSHQLPRGPISARVASRRTQRAVSRVTHRHARYRPRLVPAPAHSSPADPRCPPPRPRSPLSPRSETRARRLVRCARAGPARPRPRSLPRVLPFCLFCSNRASTRSNVASFV